MLLYTTIYEDESLKTAFKHAIPHSVWMKIDPTGEATLLDMMAEVSVSCNDTNVVFADQR